MRFPLIVSTRPLKDVRYPSVTLRPGTWLVQSNHTDSQLALTHNPDSALQEGMEFILTEVTDTALFCKQSGTESSITVYLCLCR